MKNEDHPEYKNKMYSSDLVLGKKCPVCREDHKLKGGGEPREGTSRGTVTATSALPYLVMTHAESYPLGNSSFLWKEPVLGKRSVYPSTAHEGGSLGKARQNFPGRTGAKARQKAGPLLLSDACYLHTLGCFSLSDWQAF